MNKTKEDSMILKSQQHCNKPNIRWMLMVYDLIVYAFVATILLVLYGGMDKLSICWSILSNSESAIDISSLSTYESS